jgi:NADPH-dependent 2,4-dienoyl-CoA reductase/sulfur reductase-like enzyme/Fe-S-cluster-containing hydrogenase component 2/bacterioferritin-associated ferredoxin
MDERIENHPILTPGTAPTLAFMWQGESLTARPGEMIASALFAHGIHVFGHHPKDGAPQGIFCANGQCAQCMVLANGKPVKACMTPVQPGMRVRALDGLPNLPASDPAPPSHDIETVKVAALILGGGPAGLSAAIELGACGLPALLVDDKAQLGGKLVLQTHRFFGSASAVYAGTRGIEIARKLADQVAQQAGIEVWRNTTALAVFSDGKVGIQHGDTYVLVQPEVLVVATGARERSLVFPGNTLPGVYGAGAFQTLVNRDLIRAAQRLFIVGGGNVGLIAGYHARQAGIEVVGLVEAMPECGGYRVHRDKLARLGIPIYTSHTVINASGEEHVTAITIAQIDDTFQPVPGTARTFACDTVLIAVGLEPVDVFTSKARSYGMPVFDAGDAQEIAEASAAIFTGKIAGRRAAQALGKPVTVPAGWRTTADLLKSHPTDAPPEKLAPVRQSPTPDLYPVFHCTQEIPCNPCAAACPQGLIHIPDGDIRQTPVFLGAEDGKRCLGCERCVVVCPGLAVTLVDGREDPAQPTVSLPYEFPAGRVAVGAIVTGLDRQGAGLGEVKVTQVREHRDHTVVVRVKAGREIAPRLAGFATAITTDPWQTTPVPEALEPLSDDAIVCRCERVTAGEIRALIQAGTRDINAVKAITRAGMGACGGKTCTSLIRRLFREAGIPPEAVTDPTRRPLFVETPLGAFAGMTKEVLD